MDDIAVFFVTTPRPSLVCDGTFRPKHPSLDQHQVTSAVAEFAQESCPPPSNNALDHAVYPCQKINRGVPVGNRIIS